jgi:transcription-repair coupling factor (superfamily II helicase)
VRRGGQSFVVCPRFQDLAPMRAKLAEIVLELSIVVAHGRLRGEELDRVGCSIFPRVKAMCC